MAYSDKHRQILLEAAWNSIRHGFDHGRPLLPDIVSAPRELVEKRATFVTLEKDGDLRGCIGTLNAYECLIADVAVHAYQAAFHDPRFAPLSREELPTISLSLSVLSAPEPIVVVSEADLLSQLLPGVDGLILEDRGQKSTFLPSVWDDLPDKKDFLKHLKRKAGLPEDHWSLTIKFKRYTAEKI